jgi:prepilin-type N-terminal cleavage/methylation domain-containing protein
MKPTKDKGFTLIEIIVVIAVLIILAAIAIPSIANYVNRANLSVAKANGAMVLEAASILSTRIYNGENLTLNSAAIQEHSGISVLEGDSQIDDAVVLKIISNRVVTLWSMKNGQLAMWTDDRGWVYGEDNVEYIEDDYTGLSFALASGNSAYVVKDGRSFKESNLVIPATYKGLPVIGVSNSAFNSCTNIQSVTIPSSVEYLGTSTFNGCTALTSITFPSTLLSVGNNAFNGCSSLSNVTVLKRVSEGITEGGTNMFINCSPSF